MMKGFDLRTKRTNSWQAMLMPPRTSYLALFQIGVLITGVLPGWLEIRLLLRMDPPVRVDVNDLFVIRVQCQGSNSLALDCVIQYNINRQGD